MKSTLWMAAVSLVAASAVLTVNAADFATLGGNALEGARGSIAINQAAGEANLQSNIMVLGSIGKQIGPDLLRQSNATPTSPVSHDGTLTEQVGSGASVLTGSSGVVQLNQTAGANNETSNGVVVSLGYSATP